MGPFPPPEVPDRRFLRRPDRKSARMPVMTLAHRAGAALLLLAGTAACGGRPSELVLPVGEPALIDPDTPWPKLRFGDGLVSENDRCPVTKRKLSIYFPPVYVNGLPIGFC
jgi:hypothetical protein